MVSKLIKKNNEKSFYLVFNCFTALFTLFVFATAELYITNKTELWFGYSNVFIPAVILCICLLIAAFLISIIVPDTIVRFCIYLIACLNFAIYIQGNYLASGYGELNGSSVEWGQYAYKNITNSIFWLSFILIAMILFVIGKEKAVKIISFMSGCLFFTQVLALVAIYLVYGGNSQSKNAYISRTEEFSISKSENIIVFLLDAFDADIMEELLYSDAEGITSELDGFKYYRNSVAGATRTKYSIPLILSGFANKDEISYLDYIEKSSKESPLYRELLNNNYDSRIYTNEEYVDINRPDVINNIVEGKADVSNHAKLFIRYMQLVMYRYSPHILKSHFWMYSGDFEEYKYSSSEKGAYGINDVDFYEKLKKEGIKTSFDRPVFRFYHLNGAHPPYKMNEECRSVDSSVTSELQQAEGSLNIVKEYISQLRLLGVYDSSTIIVMADHGVGRGIEQNPLFMIKEKEVKGIFERSSGRFAYDRLAGYLGDLASGKSVTIDDYMTSGSRYFYSCGEDCGTVNITEYISDGDAWDGESFYQTGIVYHSGTLDRSYKYELGTKLYFTNQATANIHEISGFSGNEGTHTWTNGKESEMMFELDTPADSDLVLNMEYWTMDGEERVIVNVNGNHVYDYVADGKESVNIFIPREYVLGQDIVLKLEFPDAHSDENDSRVMALAMKSITISKYQGK